MSEETLTLRVELIEKSLLDVELQVVDILTGALHNIDDLDDVNVQNPQNDETLVYEDGKWINKSLEELESEIPNFIFNEIPTKINSKRFQVTNAFRTRTLRVFFNGIKEKEITIINSTTFELPIDSIVSDIIECNYIKL